MKGDMKSYALYQMGTLPITFSDPYYPKSALFTFCVFLHIFERLKLESSKVQILYTGWPS